MMKFIMLVCFTCICYGDIVHKEDDLISVALVYRHGDRTPTYSYTNDPYNYNRFKWPAGKGQLITRGKQRHFEVGLWLRKRYGGFLSKKYSEEEILIQSSNIDRAIMSAESNLAGLYIPRGDQIWNNQIPWQPIPVHTIPTDEDAIIFMSKQCPNYLKMYNDLLESDEVINFLKENEKLLKYISKYSGDKVNNIFGVASIHDILKTERENELTLPKWTKSVFPKRTNIFNYLFYSLPCFKEDLSRLKSGPFWYNLITYFDDTSKNNSTKPKFMVFSGHDYTLSNLLQSIHLFQGPPPYAATIIFELRGKKDGYTYINMLYKEDERVTKLTMKNCTYNCDLKKFIEILKPITIDPKTWDKECQLSA